MPAMKRRERQDAHPGVQRGGHVGDSQFWHGFLQTTQHEEAQQCKRSGCCDADLSRLRSVIRQVSHPLLYVAQSYLKDAAHTVMQRAWQRRLCQAAHAAQAVFQQSCQHSQLPAEHLPSTSKLSSVQASSSAGLGYCTWSDPNSTLTTAPAWSCAPLWKLCEMKRARSATC